MVEQTAQIVSNERDTDLYFRVVVRAAQIAPLVQPGQFVHVRILPLKQALLRRPFSVFQVSEGTLSLLYKAVGQGTEVLSRMRPGEELSLIGPLGHGFTVPHPGGEVPLLVAGGYGMAALFLLAERSPQRGIVFVGGRRKGPSPPARRSSSASVNRCCSADAGCRRRARSARAEASRGHGREGGPPALR